MPIPDDVHFREAVAKLPTYKRVVVWEYVKALRIHIEGLERERSELADRVLELEGSLPSIADRYEQDGGL